MLIKPKTQEQEIELLVNFITISALSKVYTEKLYAIRCNSTKDLKQKTGVAIKHLDVISNEINTLINKLNEPFKTALLDLKEGIDDSIYEDYIIPLEDHIKKAFNI